MKNKILLLLFLLPSLVLGAGWHDASPYPAFPSTNVNWFAGTVTSGTVSRASGSTDVTPSSTGWSLSYSNFPYTSLHFFSPTNGLYGLVAERTNVWVKTATSLTDPASCSDFVIITNSVVILETNKAVVIASLADPMTNSYVWANGSNPLDCSVGKTNVPQLIAWSYTPLTNPVNGSKFLLITNWNMNAPQIWPGDTTWAANEREDVLGVSSNSWLRQVLQPDDPLQSAAIYQSLPIAKAWVLSNAYSFVISAFTNTAGTFDTYCAAPQTGMVWTLGQSELCSNPAQDSFGNWYCRTPLCSTTNHWVPMVSYRRIPQWSDALYLSADGSNVTSVAPSTYIASPMYLTIEPNGSTRGSYDYRGVELSVEDKLLTILHLPHQKIPVIVTNTGWCFGWQLGTPNVFTNSGTLIATNWVTVSSYFNFTPDKHHANYDQGLGHLATNHWTFDGNNDWLLWSGGYGLTNIVTNALSFMGNPVLYAQTAYWSNGWYAAGIVESNSAFYTLQIASITNWVTVSTNRFWGEHTVPSNCQSNFFTTNQISGGVTNALTNIVLTCQFTNTASTVLNVKSIDWQGSIQYTNFIDYGTFTNTNAVAYINWSSSNVTSLLSVTLTNSVNATNCLAVFTNWNVADGYTEQSYDWDGVRTLLNLFTKIAVAIGWRNTDGTLLNRYGSNYVHEIADTNLFGSLRPTSVITDTLANASAAIHFTNLNYSVDAPPWGASYTTLTNGILKDRVAAIVSYTGFGTNWVYFLNSVDAFTNTYTITCDSGPHAGEDVTQTCIHRSPAYPGVWRNVETCSDIDSLIAEANAVCALIFDSCDDPCNNNTNQISGGSLCASGCDLLSTDSGQPCVYTIAIGTKDFWPGTYAGSNCTFCSSDSNGYARRYSSSIVISQVTNSDLTAYAPSDATSVTNVSAAGVYLYQPQQSSGGVFSDICKSWLSERVVYVLPVIPSVTALAWVNTNILPVVASVGTGSVNILILWDALVTIPSVCSNGWGWVNANLWTFTSTPSNFFYATAGSSNFIYTGSITNFTWSTVPVWKQPSPLTGVAWDTTNNVGFYKQLFRNSNLTNTIAATNFLSTTALITNSLDSTLYGWGISSGIIIIDYGVDRGIPHR